MAAKKSKKKSPALGNDEIVDLDSSLGMLQNFLGSLPAEAQQQLITQMLAGSMGDFLPPAFDAPAKPRTKAQREIDRLIEAAQNEASPTAALPYLLKAEEAAKKAIGKRWEKLMGQMGTAPAGESYLDVKIELAQALTAAGQREAALAHLEDVYRLDPADPLDARKLLLAAYFDLDRLPEAASLLQNDAPEPWADWLFGRLLVALRRGERGQSTEEQLIAAHLSNPYVLSLLLNERMPNPEPILSLETGEDSEAQELATFFLPAWRNTPGAISWLRETAIRRGLNIMPPDDESAPAKRMTAREYAALQPHKYPVWIVGLHDMGMLPMPGEEGPAQHWLMFALSQEKELVGFDVAADKPSARELWDALTDFMHMEDNPGRPEKMLVFPPTLVKSLQKDAKRANIVLEPFAEAEELTGMLRDLTERMQGGTRAAQNLDPDLIRNAPLDVDEVWEAAVVHLDRRIDVAGQSLRPWVGLVMSRMGGVILWHELFTEQPPEAALANAVRMAIASPAVGESRRPRQVIVRDHDEAVSLAALSDELGFNCVVEHELPLVADAVASLTEMVLGGERSAVLVNGEGTSPADLERYYTAAATYYRAAPWKHFTMDELVGLDCANTLLGRGYGLIMGQSGITQGLAIYERLKDVKTMFSDFTETHVFDSFSVMFGEDLSIAPADLDAIEQFGWPVATPEAYPDALRIHPGPGGAPRVETPTAQELRFVTAAMEAVTWLAQHRDQKTTNVTIGDTSLTATRLGWVGDVQETK
jgi:hypothetical protein